MKTIGDKPGNFRDALIGWMLATPSGELTAVSGGVNKNKKKNKEGIATGGGAGYKPLFLGYVREGMLDGCSVGVLLRSPGSFQILELTKSKYLRAGVLYIYGLLLILLGIVILPISAAAQEKMRIIIDTDAMAEVDDQHAIAYSLFSGDHFEVEGITVNRGSDYPERTERRPYLGTVTIDDHFREAVNVARMCASPDVPVLKGPAGNYRQIKGDINNSTFDGSDAVNFIIEQAHAPSDRPLYIYAMGNLTNVALALLKDPTIAAKIEIWWLGTEWPQNYACNNHAGDLDAVDALLANPQNVTFNIISWPHKGVTFAEIKDRMTGRGPQVSPAVPGLRGEGPDFASFGDYSVHLFDKFVGSRQKENGRSLLDMIGLAAVKNNVGEFTPYEMGAPSFAVEEESQTGSQAHRYPGTWVENADNPRRVTMWRHPNRDAVYNDFFNTMDNYVLAGSTSPAQEVSQIHHREHNLVLYAKISGNMHTVANAGTYDVILTLSGAGQTAEILEQVNIHPAVEAQITPLSGSVLQGNPVTFDASNSYGSIGTYHWDFGDGSTAMGKQVTKKFSKAGINRVTLTVSNSTGNNSCAALVRVHTPETLHLPQVLFDTDAANEIDDQHAIAYAVFSKLDILAITSSGWIKWADANQTHLNPTWDSEDRSYREILNVLDLAQQSGLPSERVPMVFRGAKQPLRSVGLSSDRWFDTELVITEASNAILAAARGASPDNPVWVLPVGPATNIATALLQVRQEGWEAEFRKRIRVCWLGGTPDGASTRANGSRDPWAPWVTYKATAESGTEFVMFLERPTGFSINFDPDTDVALYPSNPLGDYLKMRTLNYVNNPDRVPPGTFKGMYDLGVLSYVTSEHLNKPWITKVTQSILLPESPYKPQSTTGSTFLDVVHEINVPAVKKDFWDTLNGKPTALPPK